MTRDHLMAVHDADTLRQARELAVKRERKPLRPPGAPPLGETYRDWRDFTDRVARPWVDNDGEDDQVHNWHHMLMIAADPWYLAVALVLADNTIRRLEGTPPVPDTGAEP